MVRVARDLIAAARSGVDDVYRALDRSLRALAEIVDAVTLWELRGDRFTCVFTSGGRYEHYQNATVSAFAQGSPLGEARRCGRERFVDAPLVPLHPADRVAVAVPLEGIPLVLYLTLRNRPQKAVLFGLLDVVAIGASVLALARDRADDRIRATYDSLTGLLSPRAFRAELADRLRQTPRIRMAPRIALVFLDTDRFKEWNDHFGHASGDEVLRKLASLLRAHSGGPGDLVARNGGDEFCLVWSDCEKSSAIVRAEALREAIATAFAAEPIRITASIGVAAYPVDARTPEVLLEAADAAMYEAKRGGRDRVSYAQERTLLHGAASHSAFTQSRA